MSSKIKHPRAKALEVAKELTAALRALCEPERFIFAGSLRRRKPEVGDIEVVYIPCVDLLADPEDLLGNQIPTNRVDAVVGEWLRAGLFQKRPKANGQTTWGAENKLALHVGSGIGVDLFQADRGNFFSLLVCRTGPAEFNTRVCLEAEQRGLRWNPYRGFEDRLSKDLVFVPRSERELFEFLRWPYLEPWERM